MESKALEFFKDWSNYLLVTTVAAMGWIAKDGSMAPGWLRSLSIWSLAFSAVFGIFTLALIPLIAEERKKDESIYDIAPKFKLFGIDFPRRVFKRPFVKLTSVCRPQHILFIFGILLYAAGAACKK
jgi:hypothetical protein